MKLVIIAIGLPGSGKTTLLKPLADKHDLVYVNKDDIRMELLGDPHNQSRNKEVWEIANTRVAAALTGGRGVIFDGTFVEQWKRVAAIQTACEAGATRIIGIYTDVSLEVAKERNAERHKSVPARVIDWMHLQLLKAKPSIKDGFDAVYTHDQIDLLEKTEFPST